MATDVTLARTTMAAGTQRFSPEIVVLDTDGKIICIWDTTLANLQDPTRASRVDIEASPDNWQTVVPWGAMTTYGSPARASYVIPPHVFVPAPPAGWRVRARLTAGDQPITCGLLVRSVTGIRRIGQPGTHHSVARDNGTEVGGATGASLTTPSFDIAGTDRLIIAGCTDDQAGASLSSCSGAGATWASLGQATNNRAAYQWKGLAPTTGSQTVTATWTGTENFEQLLGVVSFTGVDQTTPTSDTTTNTGSDTAATVTVPNVTTGDYVIDCVVTYALNMTPPYGVGADQTVEFIYEDTDARGGGSIQPGSAGGVMSWTLTEGAAWATIATRLRQAAGAPTATNIIVPRARMRW